MRSHFIEDFEQKEIIIYFESMTKSKNKYFMKLIHNDQPSLNINSLNYSYKAYFNWFILQQYSNKDELRNGFLYLGNHFSNTSTYGVVLSHFNLFIYLPCYSL